MVTVIFIFIVFDLLVPYDWEPQDIRTTYICTYTQKIELNYLV